MDAPHREWRIQIPAMEMNLAGGRRLAVYFPLLSYLLLWLISLAVAAFGAMNYLTLTRGVETDFSASLPIIGTNVALEQYPTDAALDRALEWLKRAGLTTVRQYFAWREIEPQPGTYHWEKWDRIVRRTREEGIRLVAVLFTAPTWAQRDYEKDLPTAPPNDFDAYARFAGQFAARYGEAIDAYQLWDEPNVPPHWGRRNADPVEYAQMLIPAAQALRAADPEAQIVLAGLAMNLELHRPHPVYSEILFLRGLYEIGAHGYFDVVAAKPYGMWSGPEDRRVHSGVLNFSRLILLRDEMRHYGDSQKPVWIVETGWNALPADWKGAPSPWGTDAEEVQADRLARALARVRDEWPWVTAIFPLHLQPYVPPDDPRWGFALLTRDGTPRAFYHVLAQFIAQPPPHTPPPAVPWLPLSLLTTVAILSAWRAWHFSRLARVDEHWHALTAHLTARPERVQFALHAVAVAAFYYSPHPALNFALLALLLFLFAIRLDLGLLFIVFTIPFWNYPKTLVGNVELPLAETLTWIGVAAWLLRHVALNPGIRPERGIGGKFLQWLRTTVRHFSALDWVVLALVGLGLLSTRVAGNFGVASREFRIIVLDPALLYALVRFSALSARQVRRLVYALLLSGAAVCLIGLAQFVTGDVIYADGVRRIYAVWGSPNNVGLYLGRLLPIAVAFALLLPPRARGVYGGLSVLYGITILLTFSRGALFVGVPASILFLILILLTRSHRLSPRAWGLLGATLLAGALAIIPFLGTARFQSWFQAGTGTAFFRVAVWTSAVAMIRDHPLLGVGLDNFLYEYPKYILPEAWREPNLNHPHNLVLDFWVRLGLGGVVLLVWLLLAFFRQAWRVLTASRTEWARALALGLMASMVNFIAHGLIDAAYFFIDLAYVCLLTLALIQESRKEDPFLRI